MQPREAYDKGRDRRAAEVASLAGRSKAIAGVRLALAAGGIALVAVIVWGKLRVEATALLGADVLAFLVLVVLHGRVHDAEDRAAAALRFFERGIARLEHAWDRLPTTSARLKEADHPYAADLDVFGRASVMQLIDATETRFGEERLGALLSQVDFTTWPESVRDRQQAARELSTKAAFREALATAGGILAVEKPDPSALLAWAAKKTELPAGLRGLAWLLPAVVLAAGAVLPTVGGASHALIAVLIVALVVGNAVSSRVAPLLDVASARESAATRWAAMIALIEAEAFESPLLGKLKARLSVGGRTASAELRALERVMGFVEARQNEVFRLLIGPLLMWDVHSALALARWQARAGVHLADWLGALGELEALVSLGSFAYEHPAFAWPMLEAQPKLVASALGHPLLSDAGRVGNDVRFEQAGRALVVTGSNMSGKSTLLRALGVNALLAYAGAPVCATEMRIGPARIATSMRIEDSLEQGVSHFYAELRRLKRVVELSTETGKAPPVLFLLDEILHGTNSRERVLGACAVVRQLVEKGALGAVSTHDLGITALEKELGGLVHNVHFEEQVDGDRMTFDYVLRPGIVESSNALRLMRAMGIPVPAEA